MLTVAEIIESAGAPAGMVSILPMTRELGDPDGRRPSLQLPTFTGSRRGLADEGAGRQEEVVLELGGNAG